MFEEWNVKNTGIDAEISLIIQNTSNDLSSHTTNISKSANLTSFNTFLKSSTLSSISICFI
jgi:hypothetical protein